MVNGNLYSLIPLDDFKAINGVDDRDDKLCRFCLVTATLSIEQYCKRRLLRKKIFETVEFHNDLIIPLREYPVTKILAVYIKDEIFETEFYHAVPDCGLDIDLPFAILLSPALLRYRGLSAVKAVYWAGYPFGKIPADLGSACLELAAWNMSRYKGKRVGMTGNIKGAGKEGAVYGKLWKKEFTKQSFTAYNLTEKRVIMAVFVANAPDEVNYMVDSRNSYGETIHN